jgi:diphthine-ammonia ligase
MVEAGLEAILIKVAGAGLTSKHLGKTLSQMQPTLLKLVSVSCACPCYILDNRV